MKDTLYTAIGLMSGTSADGIDIALIRTDGHHHVERIAYDTYAYPDALRAQIKPCFGLKSDTDGRVKHTEKLLTEAHIAAVKDFGHTADMIGFHGQTIFHDPDNRKTWQIGDGSALASATGMDVIYDFRTQDVLAGGQGAPLLPLYHQVLARAAKLDFPCAILNLGGVGNITWLGAGENDVVAFDTGAGNALLDDWIFRHTGNAFDADGKIAASGTVQDDILARWMAYPYFRAKPPKSLDRDAFSLNDLQAISLEDGAATVAAFTVQAVVKSLELLPERPKNVYVTGGGRHNTHLMTSLLHALDMPVTSVDLLGWSGDAMEAEGFAYLAVRAHLGLPISLPTTTGCPRPMTGGRLAKSTTKAA